MSRDICPCNICPSDICPGDNCSSDTCPGITICYELLIRSWQQDSPNIIKIWPINTLQLIPGHNCPCNICSCNICPGDICPGNICPSSHFSGTADQNLVKLWMSSGNNLSNNCPEPATKASRGSLKQTHTTATVFPNHKSHLRKSKLPFRFSLSVWPPLPGPPPEVLLLSLWAFLVAFG